MNRVAAIWYIVFVAACWVQPICGVYVNVWLLDYTKPNTQHTLWTGGMKNRNANRLIHVWHTKHSHNRPIYTTHHSFVVCLSHIPNGKLHISTTDGWLAVTVSITWRDRMFAQTEPTVGGKRHTLKSSSFTVRSSCGKTNVYSCSWSTSLTRTPRRASPEETNGAFRFQIRK